MMVNPESVSVEWHFKKNNLPFDDLYIARWIYYGREKSNGQLHRITVDGKEHRVIVNTTYNVYGIEIGM